MSRRHSWRAAQPRNRWPAIRRWLQRRVSGSTLDRSVRGSRAWQGVAVVFAVFGLLLGTSFGVILAVPLSPAAAIVPGQPSPVDLAAPRPITYVSDVLTRQEQQRAANDPANIVPIIDTQLQRQQRVSMLATFNTIADIRNNAALSDDARAAEISTLPTLTISPTLALEIAQLPTNRWQVVIDTARQQYDELWQDRSGGLTDEQVQTIRERELPYTVPPTLSETERNLVVFFVGSFLQPNRTINEEATRLRQEAARQAVAPSTVDVRRGEIIVRRGDVVNEEIYEKLSRLGLVFGAGGTVAILQNVLLGLLVAWLFATYLYLFQSHLARNRRGLAVIGGIMAVMLLAGRLLVPAWNTVPFAFPLAALAILLTVLFDGRIGMLAALVLAPLIGLQSEESSGLAITLALGSAAGVFALQRAVRSVSFVWGGLAVGVLTVISAFVFWLEPTASWPSLLNVSLFGLLNGVSASVIAFGSYHVLGRAANVVTPLQLMELAHPNQPLLHRLMREAPGTYHHSIVVSNLAEVAAEDIGADPLLARVGAYYHDIGKILRPYFFTDNQHERSNVHDVLDAKTSASIIIDHVREGEKLARQHGLPEQVVSFIPQHHGTNLVSYFYQRALQEDEDVEIEQFRYPGPKPQTREAGIMMLADGVEATVRAKAQSGKLRPAREEGSDAPNRNGMQSIADVVDQIVTERVRSGQLDECPLTLRDIATIKESFVKTLQGIYHPRVDYPPATS